MIRCHSITLLLAWFACLAFAHSETIPRQLPGEVTAEEILNGAYPFPPSPEFPVSKLGEGLAMERLSKVPAPGIHPRILISPEDLPDLRRRLKETKAGMAMHATLKGRTNRALRDSNHWSSKLYDRLSAGDEAAVLAIVNKQGGFPRGIGHYQPWFYAIVMEAFDAMVSEDDAKGRKAATAIATYAALIRPNLVEVLSGPMNDDVWRVRTSGPVTGVGSTDQGLREGVGGHLLGYAYDFGFNFMTDAQRDTVRKVISTATKGRLWMGARLPRHFRNWNWIAVGLQQPLLALAIEGEEGFDPRVYRLGVEIAKDYLTYGISPNGQSTEAVGYTQFGLVWANPFCVAATRRGDNLLSHPHHFAMLDWYLHSMEPSMDQFTSHGDGGDGPPMIWTLAMWRYFFPTDPRADFLWQCIVGNRNGLEGGTADSNGESGKATEPNPFAGSYHIIEPMLWANDSLVNQAGRPIDYAEGAKLGLPTMVFDPVRGSLNARSRWHHDAVSMQFECRVDSVGASHEHSDRSNFTLFAHGRAWAKENFRSVETRHHNNILIDGLGQGYWPGPGKWISQSVKGDLVFACADAREAYNWWWPKQIMNEKPDFGRFKFPRWASYAGEADRFQREYAGIHIERDPRPAVASFWQGYTQGDPRLWDEDGWPVRLPHNPVQRAFRSIVFHRGASPWLLVVDDIQKDEKERLYEWLMQTGMNTEMISSTGNDIILGDASLPRNSKGEPKPNKGDRLLLVRVLDLKNPADPHLFTTKPSWRLETFERRDTLVPEAPEGALSGSRTFGMDKRLVVASRAVAPDFKILLFPHRHGEALPSTRWEVSRSSLVIETFESQTTLLFSSSGDGRSLISHD